MFIVQPISSFGDLICEELVSEEAGQRQWHTFEFAVAWVNYSGAGKIKESARKFLAGRGSIRATVGLDFGRTSYEGLGSLLDLEDEGADITTHVFYDENPACTFHPKVFLFSNAERARLFIGSNNMTGAGLNTNVEAACGVTAALTDETIRAARQALKEWRDIRRKPRTTRRLTRELLEQLRKRRYVLTEEEIRARRKSEARSKSSQRKPLFGRSATRAPLFGRSTTRSGRPERATGGRRAGRGYATGSGLGEVLLMRVRPRRDGKQVAISMTVLESSFMSGAREVVSTDGTRRTIGYNLAKGIRNTARFEAPEMMGMRNPVARFQWVGAGRARRRVDRVLRFELFDADRSGEGAEILRKLEEGIAAPPVTNLEHLSHEETVLSKPDQESAQWYRLDSI